jgi:hypothetical protein
MLKTNLEIIKMSEFVKTWEEKEYGPKLAMVLTISLITYLVVAQ